MQRERSTRRQVLADCTLIAVTFAWGSTFTLVKDIVEQVPPMLFLAVRLAIGALALFLAITVLRRWRGFTMRELGWGVLMGLAIGVGYAFQTIGIQYTTASNAAFITGMLVVIAPILGVFMVRQKPHRWAILGIVMATLGLALLSLNFETGIRINEGDAIVLVCAFAFAVQVVLIARASWGDPLRLAMVQILVAGIINATGSVAFEHRINGMTPELWVGTAFMGIVVTGAAIGIQISVQTYTTVAHASLIYTLEPVFAAIFAYWLQGDRLGPITLSGAGLIVAGMLVAELGPFIRGRRDARRLATVELEKHTHG
ncbi:MAG TPA: DMT family transporter [Chloroflexia bacterium]|nr:DMT family transporter [Chloroflexia bacterium]